MALDEWWRTISTCFMDRGLADCLGPDRARTPVRPRSLVACNREFSKISIGLIETEIYPGLPILTQRSLTKNLDKLPGIGLQGHLYTGEHLLKYRQLVHIRRTLTLRTQFHPGRWT